MCHAWPYPSPRVIQYQKCILHWLPLYKCNFPRKPSKLESLIPITLLYQNYFGIKMSNRRLITILETTFYYEISRKGKMYLTFKTFLTSSNISTNQTLFGHYRLHWATYFQNVIQNIGLHETRFILKYMWHFNYLEIEEEVWHSAKLKPPDYSNHSIKRTGRLST